MLSQMYINFHVNNLFILPDLNEIWISSTDFQKILQYQLSRFHDRALKSVTYTYIMEQQAHIYKYFQLQINIKVCDWKYL